MHYSPLSVVTENDPRGLAPRVYEQHIDGETNSSPFMRSASISQCQ
jgi:hypothetical protein